MTDAHGLGRLPAPDARDEQFPMRRLLAATEITLPAWRYWWASGWTGDQGPHPYCVGYAWTHWLRGGPNTQPGLVPDPAGVYRRAQQVDEWDGEDYAGTSVRAGAKVLQGDGHVTSYWWAVNAADVATAVLSVGPVVVGTIWTAAMFTPRPEDGWRVRPEGEVVGGHAYLLDGYNTRTSMFRLKNSWGRGYGDRGFARLHLDDLHALLAADGEACLAVEATPDLNV